MTKRFCDSCGKEIDDKDLYYKVTVCTASPDKSEQYLFTDEMCEDCINRRFSEMHVLKPEAKTRRR